MALEKSEIELVPTKGEFLNYIVDTTYLLSFTVRNRSATTQMLRFFPPQKVLNFRLVNYETVRLAPGLARVIDVEFSTHEERDLKDTWTILTECGSRVTVPLVAQSVAALEMDSVVDFGKVEQTRANLSKVLKLKNNGRKDALVKFTPSEEAEGLLIVTPSSVVAKSMKETEVQVKVVSLPTVGRCEWAMEVAIEGEVAKRKVQVVADVIDCRSHLIDLQTGAEAASVQFKKVYAGANKKRQLLMVNGSEVGVSFAFQLSNDLVAKEVPPFRFIPEQGTLGPKERRKVTVVFEPPMSPIRKGWNNAEYQSLADSSGGRSKEVRKFEGLFSLVFVETEETHNFHLVGESFETHAVVSRTVLDFGPCAMKDYRQEVIDIKNEVLELPLTFSFDKVASFSVKPSSGTIPPGQREVITVMFRPQGPGRFQKEFKLLLNHTVTRLLSVSGNCFVDPNFRARKRVERVDALPEDFRLPFQPPFLGGLLCANTNDDENDASEENNSRFLLKQDAVGAAASCTPTAVDIGMIPAEGLKPPQPSHHLPANELRAEDTANRLTSAHVGPPVFDVKSLIRRRFNEAPVNAVERRDCRRELLPMDLIKIVAPIKTLQFDRITIGTCAVRPFYLFNGTNAAILVKMPSDEIFPDLRFSPHSQVIPQGRMAAFDITLCSYKVQTCQQVINFSVNHQHLLRLSLHADIIPVEVKLSYDAVTLSFSEFTDAPVTMTTITLTNEGSYEAMYWWKLPPQAPFTIEPAEGKILPMAKQVSHITFAPLQSVFTTTCDAFLVVDGASVEKKLQLTGVVEQTHCTWAKMLVKATGEAQVDLRRIAAGKTSSVTIYIANTGTRNAFFSFESLPDWLTISPVCGRVSAGETEDLILSVKSDKAENLSQGINCHVRGMKRPLKMHLTANVVAPPVTVFKARSSSSLSGPGASLLPSSALPGSSAFPAVTAGTSGENAGSVHANAGGDGKSGELVLHFGEVYCRHEKRVPVHIRNTGDVPAVVTVDLREYHPEAYLWWKTAARYPDSGVAANERELESFLGGAAASVSVMQHIGADGGMLVKSTNSSFGSPVESNSRSTRHTFLVSGSPGTKERNGDRYLASDGVGTGSSSMSPKESAFSAVMLSADKSDDGNPLSESIPASPATSKTMAPTASSGVREDSNDASSNRRNGKQEMMRESNAGVSFGLYNVTIEANSEEVIFFCYCPSENVWSRGGGGGSSISISAGGVGGGKLNMAKHRQSASTLTVAVDGSGNGGSPILGTAMVGQRHGRATVGGGGATGSGVGPAGTRSHDVPHGTSSVSTPRSASPPPLSTLPFGEKRRFRLSWKQVGADEILHPLPPLIVEAEVVPPKIEVSRTLLRFPTTVAGNMALLKPQMILLQNLCRESVRWGIQAMPNASVQANDQFFISPSSGVIPPKNSVPLTVTYLGKEEGRFCGVFQVYVEEATQKPCASFTLLGIATKPQLFVDKPLLIFPPVPLGVALRAVVYLINKGFDSIQVEYKGEGNPLVHVKFPRGHVLSHQMWRLPVEILFSSTKPVTLLSSILLSTNKDVQVEIHICATALNSLLTTSSFLQYREHCSTIAPAALLDVYDAASALPKRISKSKGELSVAGGEPSSIKNGYTNLVSVKDFSPFVFWDKKSSAGILIKETSHHIRSGSDSEEVDDNFKSPLNSSGAMRSFLSAGLSMKSGSSHRGEPQGSELVAYEMMDAVYRTMANARATVEMVTRWFNNLVLRTPVENIIDAMVQSHGNILSDCIFQACGQRPSPVGKKQTSRGNAGSPTPALPSVRPYSGKAESALRGRSNPGGVTFLASTEKKKFGESGVRKESPPLLRGETPPLPSFAAEKHAAGGGVPLKGGPSSLSEDRRPSSTFLPQSSRSSSQATLSGGGGPSHLLFLSGAGEVEGTRHAKGEMMLQGLLDFLSSRGCCLHHVPAKYLLPYEEYRQSCVKRQKILSRVVFQDRLYQSWLSVLTETIRVIFFSRYTLPHYMQSWKHLMREYYPSIDVSENAWVELKKSLTESNVYSSAESLMLFWMRSCTELFASSPGSPFATAQKIRVSSFMDLRDPRVLIAVVLTYCPALHPLFFSSSERTVVVNPTSPADHDNNAAILIHALSELAIPQLPSPMAYLEFSHLSFALFASMLMSYLPKFVSNQCITFEGKLLSSISRTIEVHNSSQKTRVYRVWMKNTLFQPSQKELAVPPQSTSTLDIEFMPRFNRVVCSRCLLIDQSSGTLWEHEPLVFKLKATPNMEPTKVFEISTCLYEPLSQDILVENPFPQDCVVSVRIQQSNETASTFQGPGSVGGRTLLKTERSASKRSASVVSVRPLLGKEEGETTKGSDPTSFPLLSSRTNELTENGTGKTGERTTERIASGGAAPLSRTPSFAALASQNSERRRQGGANAAYTAEDKYGSTIMDGSFVPRQLRNHAFFIHTDVLSLRKGEMTKLPIHFLPLARGVYVVKITFRDEREGEFSYEIRGTCKDPKPSESVDCRAEMGESSSGGIHIRSTNNALEKMVRLVEEKCRQVQLEVPPMTVDWKNNMYRIEFLSENFEGPNPFFSPAGSASSARDRSRADGKSAGKPQGNDVELEKKVLSTSAARRSSRSGSMLSTSSRDPLSGNSPYLIRMENVNSAYLRFRFTPKVAGRYPALIRLTSPIDVRIIQLSGECVVRGQRRILRFHCPARQTISQDLTITNRSDEDWLMTARVEGDRFSGLKELRVPKGKHKEYTIRYAPPWMTEGKKTDTGVLELHNSGTGQKHQYQLIGEADAPLSEDHIIVDCRAREHRAIVLTIPNVVNHDCTYFTETDLPFTEGENTVVIPRDSFAKYTLNFLPAVGGTYVGQIAFKSHQGPYVWFGITLVVSPPEKEGVIEFKTNVRTAVEMDVTMQNLASTPTTFFVRRVGAGLYGDNVLDIEASSTAIYNCIFIPTQAGRMNGRLSFCNDKVGEFWYEVIIDVEESTPEELVFNAPLGENSFATIKLTNTSEQESAMQVVNTNPKNFSFSPSLLVIPPLSDLLVNVMYSPTCVGKVQEGELHFTHHSIGQWKYSLQGTGSPPVPSPKVKCVCPIDADTAITLSFVNSLDVETFLEYSFSSSSSSSFATPTTAASHESFFSIKRAPDAAVAPGATVKIVVLYAPRVVGLHGTTLQVRPVVGVHHPQYNVCWEFPIEGNAEWRETSTPFRFKCVARKNHEEVIVLPAPGLTVEDKKQATIHFEPDANQFNLSAINSSFMCNLEEEEGTPLPDTFLARIRFTPLRSMVSSGDLLIRSTSGGSWRYRVYLEASPAPVDDVIHMSAPYKTCSSVFFDLYNVFSYKSKFAAFFTNDSSKDFEVSPNHGVLLPFTPGSKNLSSATAIRLFFRPSTRVPQVEGTLVVDTEDMQWSFKVVGRIDHERGAGKKG